ncbi:hypothetical protein BU23DRAFT_594003 [Bimuria novae-zelandiae CBS 107.79]|uniref:Malate dehydrogenase n=1 Tax=Bimuria novae-zelandiae CBS 107.79 TaxID=1447943 RepID=A0A6A5UJ58_9PLEO|nr:hypothetical protein BU23DRAFT_594003 [Bimuria novae-zelandiae CBS 107.79]
MLFPTFSTALMAVAAFTSTADARPQPPQPNGLSNLAKKMPANTLPAPTGLELKYVVLGVGTQNYTCLTEDQNAPTGTTGATAKLYDIGTRLNADTLAQWKIPAISGLALSLSAFGTWQLDMYLKAEGYSQWLGNHYFTEKIPTFSLYKTKTTPHPLAMVKKVENGVMDAPKTSCPGTTGEGAVKWLYLPDNDGMSKGGVNTVYRLETAGGSPPATCNGQKKTFEVPYAAQYWVYGPKA